jgi:arylsulfatase A-like enzyme
MIRSGRWKLVYYHGMPAQLFDLEDDPDESRDLAADPEHAVLRDALIARVLDGWDPDAIRQRMAEKEPATRLRRKWAETVRPAEPHRYKHLHPGDNWLADAPADD